MYIYSSIHHPCTHLSIHQFTHCPSTSSPTTHPSLHPTIHHSSILHPIIHLFIHSPIQQILTEHCYKPVPCLRNSETYLYLLKKMLCYQASVPLKTLYLVFGMTPPPLPIPAPLFGQLLSVPHKSAQGPPDRGSCHDSSSVGPGLM